MDPALDTPLRLMTVHAHPDDEASKGAPTVARYAAEGVGTVLVCCTGGEEGDVINKALDTPEVRQNLHLVRNDELAAAAAIIGYDVVHLLGYRDSGMAGTPPNEHPESFAQADLDEAIGRLVAVIRHHLPRRSAGLSAPRPPAGARHLDPGLRAGRRPHRLSRPR
jgi:mycothiol S-conjugate amidase